jgi:hypothetical protein
MTLIDNRSKPWKSSRLTRGGWLRFGYDPSVDGEDDGTESNRMWGGGEAHARAKRTRTESVAALEASLVNREQEVEADVERVTIVASCIFDDVSSKGIRPAGAHQNGSGFMCGS